jgi:hypothetical protein
VAARADDDQRAVEGADAGQLLELGLSLFRGQRAQMFRIQQATLGSLGHGVQARDAFGGQSRLDSIPFSPLGVGTQLVLVTESSNSAPYSCELGEH